MTKLIQKDKKITTDSDYLSTWYYNLPANEYTNAKDLIINRCMISDTTFYNWLNGKSRVPQTAKIVINAVVKTNVFPI